MVYWRVDRGGAVGQVHRAWTARSRRPASREHGDRDDDDDDRRAEGARQVEQPVGVGELDAEAVAADQALADDGGDHGRAGGDPEAADHVRDGGRAARPAGTVTPLWPPSASTTSSVDSAGGGQARPGEHEDRVEHEHRRRGPRRWSGCSRRPGRTAGTGRRAGWREDDDERDGHPGEELVACRRQRRGETEHRADREGDRCRPQRAHRCREVVAGRGDEIVEHGRRARHDDRRDVLHLDPCPPHGNEHGEQGDDRGRLGEQVAEPAVAAGHGRGLLRDLGTEAANGRHSREPRAGRTR